MSIYPRGEAHMVSVGSGKDRYRQTFKKYSDAKVAEALALARLEATGSALEAPTAVQPLPGEGKTLGDAYERVWSLTWSKLGHADTPKYNCVSLFRTIAERTPLAEIDTEMVDDAFEEWTEDEVSAATMEKRIGCLRQMMTFAMHRGWISKLPVWPKYRKTKGRVRWLSHSEESMVLSKCQELGFYDLYDYIIVAIDTGFRRSEVLNFRTEDFMRGQLHLHPGETKNGDARTIPATDRVAAILQRRSNLRKPFGDVFTKHMLQGQWLRLRKALDLMGDKQFIVHMLRHTCASRLIQEGVNIPIVQQWMGHKDIQSTMRYAHLAPNALGAALEVMNRRVGQPVLTVVPAKTA